MPRRNEGFGEYCGRPNPFSHRSGASCVRKPGEHKLHRDLDGAEWADLLPTEPLTEEPKRKDAP